MVRFHSRRFTHLAALTLALSACNNAEKKAADSAAAQAAADKRINARFAKTNIPHLKQMLVDQICSATGGGCTYTGKTMKDAHKGMKISDADFTALVEDLTKSLDKHNVAAIDKDELITALGGMKGDIVGQ